jgi:hypothetical protein
VHHSRISSSWAHSQLSRMKWVNIQSYMVLSHRLLTQHRTPIVLRFRSGTLANLVMVRSSLGMRNAGGNASLLDADHGVQRWVIMQEKFLNAWSWRFRASVWNMIPLLRDHPPSQVRYESISFQNVSEFGGRPRKSCSMHKLLVAPSG